VCFLLATAVVVLGATARGARCLLSDMERSSLLFYGIAVTI